ncbi:hypothetical protein BS47DRAFT_1376304 [Hydnum rufescens UP504]|uniref:Methylenetetrahydrofolate dehydrogenase n=1 Tax=Hydnum rufescens UP504 TaxID=1448309 RepID=A0A9P6DVE9_9AGAM|nr:hypothetical protein BS47DRAFT_1376304 [Hydnum rufescens UP504]
MATLDLSAASTAKKAGKLLKADLIADTFRTNIHRSILLTSSPSPNHDTAQSKRIKLVGILATSSKPSEMYAEFTRRRFVLQRVGAAAKEGMDDSDTEGQGAVENAIVEANSDESVGGIMVYYPIFGGLQDHYLQQVVSPAKDVEGLNVKFHYNLYHNIRFISPMSLLSSTSSLKGVVDASTFAEDNLPHGVVKSILPCTPLAIVKCLEYIGVYNRLLDYGDRAYGRTVTVINRSEVVGRPLAALLANDGARVFSVDIDSIQEYNKRAHIPSSTADSTVPRRTQYHTHHVVRASSFTLQECLALSDVVISAVPSVSYKVKTEWLKDGCVCVNVASEKNFETDVRDKASLYIPAVGKVTILMLLRNLLRLREYQSILLEQEKLE